MSSLGVAEMFAKWSQGLIRRCGVNAMFILIGGLVFCTVGGFVVWPFVPDYVADYIPNIPAFLNYKDCAMQLDAVFDNGEDYVLFLHLERDNGKPVESACKSFPECWTITEGTWPCRGKKIVTPKRQYLQKWAVDSCLKDPDDCVRRSLHPRLHDLAKKPDLSLDACKGKDESYNREMSKVWSDTAYEFFPKVKIFIEGGSERTDNVPDLDTVELAIRGTENHPDDVPRKSN